MLTNGANQKNILIIQIVKKKGVSVITNIDYTPHVVVALVNSDLLVTNSLRYQTQWLLYITKKVVCLEKLHTFQKKIASVLTNEYNSRIDARLWAYAQGS